VEVGVVGVVVVEGGVVEVVVVEVVVGVGVGVVVVEGGVVVEYRRRCSGSSTISYFVLVVVDWLVLISVGSISYYSTCSTYLLSLTVDDANDIRSCDKY